MSKQAAKTYIMRISNGRFRNTRPSTEEAKAILLLVRSGFLKLVLM